MMETANEEQMEACLSAGVDSCTV